MIVGAFMIAVMIGMVLGAVTTVAMIAKIGNRAVTTDYGPRAGVIDTSCLVGSYLVLKAYCSFSKTLPWWPVKRLAQATTLARLQPIWAQPCPKP